MSTENAIALRPTATVTATPLSFSDEERKIIRESFMPGASEAEMRALVAIAEHMRLDPFKRQIHFVKRWQRGDDGQGGRETWSFQTAIDGFRSAAEDTGEFAGSDEPTFAFDEIMNPATGEPTGKSELVARVVVHRKGFERSFVGVARYTEFVQTKRDGTATAMWTRAPHNMLAKCAEAQALRKAFPQRLAGADIDPGDIIDTTATIAPADVEPVRNIAPAIAAQPLLDAEIVPAWPERFAASPDIATMEALLTGPYKEAKEGLSKDVRAKVQAAYKARKAALIAAPPPSAPAATAPPHDSTTGEVQEPGSEG